MFFYAILFLFICRSYYQQGVLFLVQVKKQDFIKFVNMIVQNMIISGICNLRYHYFKTKLIFNIAVISELLYLVNSMHLILIFLL